MGFPGGRRWIPRGTQIVIIACPGAVRFGTLEQRESKAFQRHKSVLEHLRHLHFLPQDRIDDLGKAAACPLSGRRQAALHVAVKVNRDSLMDRTRSACLSA
jgi:hypothetical protein